MIKSKVIKKKADKKTKRIDHGINEENILARGPGRPSLAPAAAGHSDDSVDMFAVWRNLHLHLEQREFTFKEFFYFRVFLVQVFSI